jgi:predicted RNase H-like nuclease (RuvC/YqgF family)
MEDKTTELIQQAVEEVIKTNTMSSGDHTAIISTVIVLSVVGLAGVIKYLVSKMLSIHDDRMSSFERALVNKANKEDLEKNFERDEKLRESFDNLKLLVEDLSVSIRLMVSKAEDHDKEQSVLRSARHEQSNQINTLHLSLMQLQNRTDKLETVVENLKTKCLAEHGGRGAL